MLRLIGGHTLKLEGWNLKRYKKGLEVAALEETMKENRLKWFGHVQEEVLANRYGR